MFPFKEPFNHTMVTKLPWARLGFDIFTFHRLVEAALLTLLHLPLLEAVLLTFLSVWSYQEVKKVLPSAVYITLLRDPVNCYESNYVYMGLQNAFKMDVNKFALIKVGNRSHLLDLFHDFGCHGSGTA